VTYAIWSLRNIRYTQAQFGDRENYLDECADLVWESLLEPEKEKLPKERGVYVYMSYEGGLKSGTISGREYSITLGRSRGVTNFYVAGERIYVLTVLNATQDDPAVQRFLKSFAIREDGITNPTASGTGVGQGAGVGVGPGMGSNRIGAGGTGAATDSPTDYNRVFTTREVTQKARLLYRSEPSYTESARKYSVQGTVVVRAVISSTGQIVKIKAVKGLPHGLTARALEAAKGIKWEPAIKDGHPVAQYIQIEYNFNLY
jgi:TonB family protein